MENVIDCTPIKCFKLFWIKMIKIYQYSKGNVYYKWKNTKKSTISSTCWENKKISKKCLTQLYCYDSIICVAHEKRIFERKMTRILKENEKTSWQIENHVITYKSSHHEKQKSSEEDEKGFLKKFLTRTKRCDKI